MSLTLQIPSQYERAVKELLDLPKESRHSLLEALKSAPPALLIGDLSTQVAQKTKLKPDLTKRIVRMLASLHSTRGEQSSDELSDNLVQAILTLDKDLAPQGSTWDEFKDFITSVLDLEQSLGVTSKAIGIMTAHPKVFIQSKVLTDFRPVFERDVEKGPAAAVIVHTIQITYAEDDQKKYLYVAMDDDDLKSMRLTLTRALQKATALKAMAKRTGITCLEPEQAHED